MSVMWGGYDMSDSLFICHIQKYNGLIPAARPIVNTGKYMRMYINPALV